MEQFKLNILKTIALDTVNNILLTKEVPQGAESNIKELIHRALNKHDVEVALYFAKSLQDIIENKKAV